MQVSSGMDVATTGLLQWAPEAMLVMDPAGRIVEANALAESLLGYSQGSLTGQPLERLIPVGLRELHRQHLDEYFRNPRPLPGGAAPLSQVLRADGSEIPVQVSLGPLPGSTGLLVLAVIRDVTEHRRALRALEQTSADLEVQVEGRNAELRRQIAGREQAEAALREAEGLYRQLVENQPDLICRFLPDTTLTFVNEAYARFFEREPRGLIGSKFIDFLGEEAQSEVRRQLAAFTPESPSRQYEHRTIRADGVARWHLWHDFAFFDEQGNLTGFQSIGVDITGRIQAETSLQKINRALQLRNACNRILVHAVDEASLFQEICGLIVSQGGYRLAWVGLSEADEGRTVQPAGQAGYEDGYLQSARISWADDERGQGPTGKAIRGGQPVVARNILTEPDYEPWREEALRRGYASSVALPLCREGVVLGALNIYSAEPGSFDGEEIQLLADIADDLAYGVSALRIRERQRQMAEALRESEGRFRQLAEATFEGISISRQGKLIDVSNQLAEMLGYAPAEMIGREIVDFVAPETRELVRERLRSGDRQPVEHALQRKDGSTIHVEVRVRTTSYRGEEVRLSAIRDITERKRIEDALRRGEERFKYISQTISDFAYSCLKPPGGRYTVDWMTGAVERITGYRIEEVQERGCWMYLVLEEDLPLFQRALLDLPPNESSVCELRIRRKDGTIRWIMAYTLSLADAEGFPGQRLYGGCQDITERKVAEEERLQLERRLLHSQKLESLGVLAGGIAHDFNNLLMVILGYADLALVDLSPGMPARPMLEGIINASRRAADLCRQMLAYSGRGKFVIERIHLEDVVNETVHLVKTAISKKVLLNLNLEPNLPPLEGDASQVRQVLMNLVINASEAIGDRSGVITISTGMRYCNRSYLREMVLSDQLPEGNYLSLEVSDTGCGMDRETQARIFEPFFTTKFTGRGLGMAAVLGIMRGHRGAVKVYSEPGRGTTFRLLFPAAEHALGEEELLEGNLRTPWRGEGRVLLVDDDETVLAVGKAMLQQLGFSVLTAEDGLEALKVYGEHERDFVCVLLDLTMPHMNGEETFRGLRQMNPDVRVIICSGYSDQEIASRFAGKGLAGCLQKPYLLADLARVMKMALEIGPRKGS